MEPDILIYLIVFNGILPIAAAYRMYKKGRKRWAIATLISILCGAGMILALITLGVPTRVQKSAEPPIAEPQPAHAGISQQHEAPAISLKNAILILATMGGSLIIFIYLLISIIGDIQGCSKNEQERLLTAKTQITAWYDSQARPVIASLLALPRKASPTPTGAFPPEGACLIVAPDGNLVEETFVLTETNYPKQWEDVKYVLLIDCKGTVSTGFWKRKGSVSSIEGFATQYDLTVYDVGQRRIIFTETFLSGNVDAVEKQEQMRKSVLEQLERYGVKLWIPTKVGFSW